MKGFPQTLFDKLLDEHRSKAVKGTVTRLTVEQVKDSVARDLEALLNTRAVISETTLAPFPECSRSMMSYGLSDFAGLSLASIDDRAFVCRSLETAIARHEPRLRNVRAVLEISQNSINKLFFNISALLVLKQSKEPVTFDAMLQPSTLQYSIVSSNRTSAVRLGL